MSENSNLYENFKRVTYRKRNNKKYLLKENSKTEILNFDPNIDTLNIIQKIEEAKVEIQLSDILQSTIVSFREALHLLENQKIFEIYCLGLGHINERVVSRYQLALLLCLKDIFNVPVYIHDPIFYTSEKYILKYFNLIVLNENLEGKYRSKFDCGTIYFLPHCPKQLTNNLLWANWSLNLKNCIIIANSFHNIINDSPKRVLNEQLIYLLNIFPYILELPIINTFKYFDVFNDTAIHIFPINKLLLIPEDFWNEFIEPQYDSETVEFIKK